MAQDTDTLVQLSSALKTRAAAARDGVVAIHGPRLLTGTLWSADLVVASEQSLPKRDAFDVVLPGGTRTEATLGGRDPGTNIALLRLPSPLTAQAAQAGTAEVGALALAFGADGAGGARARLGVVNFVGPEWHSRAGGRIAARIVLDLALSPAEEGGPAFDADGLRLGITTFGPGGRVLVIPAATVDAVVPALMQHGRVPRGWLGAAFQPVAVPDPLQAQAGQAAGLMVLSVAADGPAAKCGVTAGDIVLSIDGVEASRVRRIVPRLGPESIGRSVALRLLRGGALATLQAVIEARPPA